jgi:ppGpp synthetase/RelA/SpoT-type nucleotidyltranferase
MSAEVALGGCPGWWDMVEWSTPAYSKRRVDRAGEQLVDPETTRADRAKALEVVNNWRSSHAYPLNTFQMNLRYHAGQVDPANNIVAQRMKRLPSIEKKIVRFHGMGLSRMQDLGGCRAVVSSVAQVDELVKRYNGSRANHELYAYNDYIEEPQDTGYRSYHLKFKHFSKKSEFDGLRIEIQLRSAVQHAWATAVETVDFFTRQALKSSQGSPEWLRFFALMGSEIAFREASAPVPGVPVKLPDVRSEIADLARALNAVPKLQTYGAALKAITDEQFPDSHFFLLTLNTSESAPSLAVRGFRKEEQEAAALAYEHGEAATANNADMDSVLVSVDSMTALRKAYPNYFADTRAFVTLVQRAIQ